MIKNAIILAGGSGTRMKPLTNYIPKGLVEVNNKPLILGIIDMLRVNNVENIFVTYNYLSNILFNSINDKVEGFINTLNQDNSYFLFSELVKNINEPTIIISCDLVIDIDLEKIYDDYLLLGKPAIMVIGTEPQENIDGDFIICNENQNIYNLTRKIKSNLYCTGMQIINPFLVNQICSEEYNFNNVWSQLFGTKDLKVSSIRPSYWKSYDSINQIIK